VNVAATPVASLVSEPEPVKKRTFADLYIEIAAGVKLTRQYAWDNKHTENGKLIVPSETCKLIFPRQWLEAMRVGVALYRDRAAIRQIGVPEAVAHSSGRAGLRWSDGDKWFEVHIAPESDARSFSCTWQRRNESGVLSGTSRDLRDLASGIESTFAALGTLRNPRGK
jgi:hypothetical protein